MLSQSEEEITSPSLEEELIMESRLQREIMPLLRYNPAKGQSYHQDTTSGARSASKSLENYDEFVKDYYDLLREHEQVHNIIADVKEVDGYL